MYPLLAVILSACCLRVVSSSILVDTVCVENSTECYALYKEDGSEVKWGVASRSCKTLGQSLASIPDEATQLLMDQFSNSNLEGTAWLSGRTDSVGDWIMLDKDKQPFDLPIEGANDTTKPSCVLQLDPDNRRNYAYVAVDYYANTGRRALCQYSLQNYSQCTNGYNISNICYKVSDEDLSSMDMALSFCSNLVDTADTKSELSYSQLDSSVLINNLWYNKKVMLPSSPEQNQMWIGVRRKYIWTWTAPEQEPFTYTNWAQNQVSDAEPTMCLVLDLKANSWVSTRCNSTSPYYVCTAEPEEETTTTTTTTTTTISTTTKVNNVAVSELPQATEATNGFQLVLIIVFSVGGFLFLVGIIVAVYISSLGGKNDDTSSYDDSEQSESNLDIYHHPDGIQDLIGSTKSRRTPSDRRGVIRKSRVKSHHEQVQDIFIAPRVTESPPPPPLPPQLSRVDSKDNDEAAQRYSKTIPLRGGSAEVTHNQIYSVNRSQFTEATLPAPGGQTYQNITSFHSLPPQPATKNTGESPPPLPPKRTTILRSSSGVNNEVPVVARITSLNDEPPSSPPPPIPLPPTPPSEREPSPTVPSIISSGVGEVRAMSNTQERIDLARGNMMY